MNILFFFHLSIPKYYTLTKLFYTTLPPQNQILDTFLLTDFSVNPALVPYIVHKQFQGSHFRFSAKREM
jgi:hypothetical protein